jgi:hypothetical protein
LGDALGNAAGDALTMLYSYLFGFQFLTWFYLHSCWLICMIKALMLRLFLKL